MEKCLKFCVSYWVCRHNQNTRVSTSERRSRCPATKHLGNFRNTEIVRLVNRISIAPRSQRRTNPVVSGLVLSRGDCGRVHDSKMAEIKKRTCNNSGGLSSPDSKKAKRDNDEIEEGKRVSFSGFEMVKILKEDAQRKAVFVQGIHSDFRAQKLKNHQVVKGNGIIGICPCKKPLPR